MSNTPGLPPRGSGGGGREGRPHRNRGQGRPPGPPRNGRTPAPASAQAEPPRHGPEPRPPRELDRDPTERRSFELDGTEWIAWVAGKGAWGSGAYGLGMVVAVHFAPATAPDLPEREALLARGRFAGLYDEELRELFEKATPIVRDQPRRERPKRDRRSRDW